MENGSLQKQKITKRLEIPSPPLQRPGATAPFPNGNEGCRELQRVDIEETGEVYDPVTDRRFKFNLRAVSIVQELRHNRDLDRLIRIYAPLYRLKTDEARAEILEFLQRLEALGLYRPQPSELSEH